MTDDAVLPILQRIQEDLAAVKRQGESNAHTLNDLRINFAVLDRSLTREFEIVKQDVRMIRSTIEDMGIHGSQKVKSRCCTKTSTGCKPASRTLKHA